MRDHKTRLNEKIKELRRGHPRQDQFALAARSLEEGKIQQAYQAVGNGINELKRRQEGQTH